MPAQGAMVDYKLDGKGKDGTRSHPELQEWSHTGKPSGDVEGKKEEAVPTEAPTILLANRNRPVVQPIGPLATGSAYGPSYVRLHCLVNGLPHWATGYLVRQQAGL